MDLSVCSSHRSAHTSRRRRPARLRRQRRCRGSIGWGSRRPRHCCRNRGVRTGRPEADPYRFPLASGWLRHHPAPEHPHRVGGDAERARVCGRDARWPSVVPLRTCVSRQCLHTQGRWHTSVIPILCRVSGWRKSPLAMATAVCIRARRRGPIRTASRALARYLPVAGGPPRARAVRAPPVLVTQAHAGGVAVR